MFCDRCGLLVTNERQHNKWCKNGRVSRKRQRTGSVSLDDQKKKMIGYITDDISHMTLKELGVIYKMARRTLTELK